MTNFNEDVMFDYPLMSWIWDYELSYYIRDHYAC